MAKKPIVPKTTYPLHEAIAIAVQKHESQAEAARQFGIGKAYLSRLMAGRKENPSDEILLKMGIARHTTIEYSFVRPARQPAP